MPTSKIPLYPYAAKDAMKRGEIEKWRESFRENCACAGGIDILIRETFDGMHLKDGTVEKIIELYGHKRVGHVLANTVQERRDDGRIRPSNRDWANSHYIPEDEMHIQKGASVPVAPDAAPSISIKFGTGFVLRMRNKKVSAQSSRYRRKLLTQPSAVCTTSSSTTAAPSSRKYSQTSRRSATAGCSGART